MSKLHKLLATGLGIAVLAFLVFGCSTETPWEPPAIQTLTVNVITGPDSTAAVAHNSHATFTWSARGGSGVMSGYQFYLEGVETTWRSLTDTTAVTYVNLVGPDTLTFHIRVVDSQTNTAEDSRWFAVSDTAAAVPNTDRPVVTFASFPEESSFVATGKSVTFTWSVSDTFPASGVIQSRHILTTGGDTTTGTWSDWSQATSVTHANLTARDPAVFMVEAKDEDDSLTSASTSVFIIKAASILWIDDYVFTDPYGNVDRAAERAEAAFYHNLMEGFAFADWDYNDEDSLPTLAGLQAMGITSIIWNAEDGDANATLWYEIGAAGGGVLKDFCDNGGNVLVSGYTCLWNMYNSVPPAAGDFEFDYLGVDSTGDWTDDYFTWAVRDTALGAGWALVPDSSKIDVAKDGGQERFTCFTPYLRTGATPIFVNGLLVDGSQPIYGSYLEPIGHFFDGGTFKTVLINFDTYYMPEPDMKPTYRDILEHFGE
jgi:hypothetical protein